MRKAEDYLHIAGPKQTYALAIQNYQKARELGHKKARDKLLWLHSYLPNEISLKNRYRKALVKAKQGDGDAQFTLAEMCEFGLGVQPNQKRAIAWYKKAANNNNGKAQNRLGELYVQGRITSEEATDNNQALQWIQSTADNNQAEAQFKLAGFYLNGEHFDKNEAQAFYWFKKSAQNNHIQAQMQTGTMLKNGQGVTRNYEESLVWFERAAAQDFEPANIQVKEVNTILDDIFLLNFK